MATVTVPAEPRVALYNVSWQDYETLLRTFDERPGLRLTYDRGTLEIMTTSHGRERRKRRVGRLVEALTEELNIPISSGGSMTFKREDLERGLEPDECYWIEHEAEMRDKEEYDPLDDPPPDLAIESEATRSVSVDRMGIYAALHVPEVWRYDGETLGVYWLVRAKYALRNHSRAFPFLPMEEVTRFLHRATQMDETSLVRSFRAWVRKHARSWRASS